MARRFKGDVLVENNLDINNELGLSAETNDRALELDSSGKVKSSSVTSTELGHLSGVTSAIQTQLDSKAAEADVVLRDGSQAFTADQSMGSNKLTDLAAPTADNDAARKIDVDTAQAGLKVKDPVDLVSTSNITLSGEQSIDGTLTSTSRVLVAGQTDATQNGIYVTDAGAWTRATDFDGNPTGEVSQGNIVYVLSGTDNADTQYVLNTTDASNPQEISVGSDTIGFAIYSRAQAIQAGDGLDKSGLTLSVDVSDIAGSGLEDDGSNNLRISSTGIGTGLTGGSGSDIEINFGTSGQQAVAAATLASNSNAEGASLIGIEDSAGDYTATDVEGALAEVKTDLSGKQDDVVTTEGDIIVGNGAGNADRLAIGSNGQVLQSNGTTAAWATLVTTDELVKVSANDTTSGYLEDKIVVAEGSNTSDILEVSTLNDGGDEDVQIQIDETKIDHDVLANYVANEHIDHSSVEIATAADSGLAGGGDITTTRNLSVDINGTTEETTIANDDEFLIHDTSAGVLRKITAANVLANAGSPGDINETSFSGANNQAVAADVTGFAFANGVVRSFSAHLSIVVDATADLYEEYEIQGIQKGASWEISQQSVGDDTNVNFSITSAGQIQYTSDNYAGFASLTIKFRAITTSV